MKRQDRLPQRWSVGRRRRTLRRVGMGRRERGAVDSHGVCRQRVRRLQGRASTGSNQLPVRQVLHRNSRG